MARTLFVPYPTESPAPAPPDTYQRIQTGPEMFGSLGAAAQQRFGAAARDVGRLYGEVAAQDAANQWEGEANKLLYGDPSVPGDRGFYGKEGRDALDAMPQAVARLTELRNRAKAGLLTLDQQKAFDGQTFGMSHRMNAEIGRHYDRAFKSHATAVNKSTAELALHGIAAGAEDQTQVDDNRERLRAAYVREAQNLHGDNLSPEIMNAALARADGEAVGQQVRAIARRDPVRASQLLDQHRDKLLGPAYDMLKRETDSLSIGWAANRGASAAIDGAYHGRGTDAGAGVGHVAPKAERIAFAREYAISKGINPDAVVATMAGEGLNVYTGDNGTSFGDFQLHVGGGMGDQAVAAGVNIRDPKTWKEQAKFAIDQMADNRHRGAAWYAGQWHGAPDWAASSFASGGTAAPDRQTAGLVEPGNIDLNNRPTVQMPDGKIATVRSISVGTDQGTVLIPTISDDGRVLSDEEAKLQYSQTGKHLGVFKDIASADAYGRQLSQAQGRQYGASAAATPKERSLASMYAQSDAYIDRLGLSPDASAEAKLRGRAKVREDYNAIEADWNRQQRAEQQRQDQAMRGREAQIWADVTSDNPKISARSIAIDPAFAGHNERRQQMISLINNPPGSALPPAQSWNAALSLLDRIRRPEGDPERINDAGVIYQSAIDGRLNKSDFEFVRKEFDQQRTPGGEVFNRRKSDFIKSVTPLIDKSNPLMGKIDQSGKMQLYQFEWDVDRKIDEYRAAGKDPSVLLDPAKPDFMGTQKTLEGYQKPLQQSIRDQARSLGARPNTPPAATAVIPASPVTGAPPAAATRPNLPVVTAPIPPVIDVPHRLSGETPADYMNRIGRGAMPVPQPAPVAPPLR